MKPQAPEADVTLSPHERASRAGAVVVELVELLERMRSAQGAERRALYARCLPLLASLAELTGPPLQTRELVASRHEAGWHLRSLAGLAEINTSADAEHAAWARASLDQLAAQLA